MRWLAPALLWVALLLPGARAQAADPTQQWRTITTPHFYVHYYRNVRHNERALAQKVARAAEAAHSKLVPILGHAPSERTHLVVTDNTDGANGSAQIVPLNVMRVFATGPSSIGSLNDYDDWIYGLLVHEYTHILHIDSIHGLARVINAVMGKTWAPNQIQPRWFIEGLAVYHETMRTAGGRLRNAIYDMYLRTAVLQSKLLQMDQISSATRLYPRGTVPYLYGSRFLKYIADRYGEKQLTRISHAYGGTPIPYAINRTAKKVLGRTFAELYQDFKLHLQRRYELQRAAVTRRGLTPFTRITSYGESCGSPRYSRDGSELVFIDSDGRSISAIKVLDVATNKVKERYKVWGSAGVDLTPDGQQLVYGQSATWRTFYSYHDLFVRDRRSGAERQLTFGLRARDPAVSPDGAQVAFSTNELGSMSLNVVPLHGGVHRVLIKGSRGDQIFTPRWSPDGRKLVYSRWRRGGNRDLYLLDLGSGRAQRLTDDRAMDMDPQFSADGARIYFASDRTGIFNLYSLTLASGRLRQVSNVIGGAFTPAVAPDERRAYYVGYSAKGFDLHSMALDRGAYLPALPYVNQRPAPAVVPDGEPYPERPYSPLRTVYPRAWSLLVGLDSYGTTLGIDLVGGDVVGHHAYRLVANVSGETGAPSYSVAYSFNRWWPSIRLDTSRFEGPRGGLIIDGKGQSYVEQNYGAGVGLGLPVLRMRGHFGSINLGYRFNYFRDADETEVLVTPEMIPPRLPQVGILSGLTLGLSYSNVERYAYSVSAESGRAISVGVSVFHPALGSDYQTTTLSWAWTEYLDIPWFEDHVLALRLGGGVSVGNLSRRGVFFVGGFPEQDVLRTLFDVIRPGGVYLRGYPPGAAYGNQYHLFNLEYRLPLFDVERGLSSLPVYFTHVHLAAFVDVGNAFFGALELEQLKVGVGGELLLELVIGYVLPTTFRLGYARGLMEGGGNQFHLLIGRPW